jgi:ABC-type sugar transport system ATPase subunit
MDEPLTNLDPELTASLLTLVVEIVSSDTATLLYVTHDQGEAKAIAGGNLLEMIDGRILSP